MFYTQKVGHIYYNRNFYYFEKQKYAENNNLLTNINILILSGCMHSDNEWMKINN